MFLSIVSGYVSGYVSVYLLSGIVFYSYILSTSQEDPHEAYANLEAGEQQEKIVA